MGRSVWAIVAGLVLAIFGAAIAAKIFGLPLADLQTGEKPIWHLLRLAVPVAAFTLPAALAAILLSEARNVRGVLYWISVGAILAILAHITLTSADMPQFAQFQSTRSFNTLLGMGLLGGFIYWIFAGHRGGRLAAAFTRAGRSQNLDERALRKRCRGCTFTTLALGLLPLALVGWYAIYKPTPMLPVALAAKAEADGTKQLADAGLA